MDENWQKAEEILDRAKKGELKITKQQFDKLSSLVEGHKAQQECEFELRKAVVTLKYEQHIYLSKLTLVEKLGVRNKWKHPLLNECREIIYAENNHFEVTDFMTTPE